MDDIINSLIGAFTPGEKVLVAMSGGVDSSVAAWAAREAGCTVAGVTLMLYDTDIPFWKDAERVANQLSVEWKLADYRQFFKEDVITDYISTYRRGETPNPCCICNRVGKTKYLFDEMHKAGATKIVTGHYAGLKEHNGRKVVTSAVSMEKDQSYYLSLMHRHHIDLMIYPFGKIESKACVRDLAARFELSVAQKRDSYEACFLKGEDYRSFLISKIGEGKKGNFIFHSEVVGIHEGIFNYTMGQKKGLENIHTGALYVKNIDVQTGEIQLAEKKEVFLRGVRLRDAVFDKSEPVLSRAHGRLRHKMADAPCLLEIQQGGRAVILFDTPQFAPAPGQIAALYDGDRVMGGGIVDGNF